MKFEENIKLGAIFGIILMVLIYFLITSMPNALGLKFNEFISLSLICLLGGIAIAFEINRKPRENMSAVERMAYEEERGRQTAIREFGGHRMDRLRQHKKSFLD